MPSQSTLQSLPLELLQLILSELNLEDLKVALLTCHTFWKIGSSSQTVKNILFKQLDAEDVRNQAIATWQIRESAPLASRQEHLGYLDTFLKSRRHTFQGLSFTIRDAKRIGDFQHAVRQLTRRFINECLANAGVLFDDEQPKSDLSDNQDFDSDEIPPSKWQETTDEICRVMRAFYLTDAYYSTFTRHGDNSSIHPQDFLCHLAAWEIEALVCTHSFLYRRITSFCNMVCSHDIRWDAIGLIENFASGFVNYVLVQGLDVVYSLLCLKGHELKQNLLRNAQESFMLREPYRDVFPLFSRYGLTQHIDTLYWKQAHSSQSEEREESALYRDRGHIYVQTNSRRHESPFVLFEDQHGSHIEAWLEFFWRLKEADSSETTLDIEHYSLCTCGYALWDEERIMAFRVTERGFNEVVRTEEDGLLELQWMTEDDWYLEQRGETL